MPAKKATPKKATVKRKPNGKGNKNAEKYTVEKIIELMDEAQRLLISGEATTLARAYLKLGVYYQLVCSWEETHAKNRTVLDSIKKTRGIAQLVLEDGALTGDLNTPSAIFVMKTKYGYIEKQEVSLKTETQLISVSAVSPDGKRTKLG